MAALSYKRHAILPAKGWDDPHDPYSPPSATAERFAPAGPHIWRKSGMTKRPARNGHDLDYSEIDDLHEISGGEQRALIW